MSLRQRITRLENVRAGGPQYAGGTLVAERWYGDVDPPAVAPVGLFRCEALEAEPLPWFDPAAYRYSESELERIAADRQQLLIVVIRETREGIA